MPTSVKIYYLCTNNGRGYSFIVAVTVKENKLYLHVVKSERKLKIKLVMIA